MTVATACGGVRGASRRGTPGSARKRWSGARKMCRLLRSKWPAAEPTCSKNRSASATGRGATNTPAMSSTMAR